MNELPDLEPLMVVNLARRHGPESSPAEATDNPHLAIVPARTRGVRRWEWWGWFVLHVPTGKAVPLLSSAQIEVVRDMARRVAGLDWSSPDVERYKSSKYYWDACRTAGYEAHHISGYGDSGC
jgi:hypothetical protein